MNGLPTAYIKGRGAQLNPANSFHSSSLSADYPEAIDEAHIPQHPTEYIEDQSKGILNQIQSPDIPGSWSLNPYQGCEHGCIYCYARNSHEYWGYSAGLDFEQKIMIKKRAVSLLRERFSSPSWKPAPISLSGNTDCYQPIERKMQITRQLLQVCLDYKNPVGIITKNALVLRDLDILQELHKHQLVSVFTSITSVDEALRRKLEPRTSTYAERLQTLEKLSKAGIPTGVMNAPIIPGINDTHMAEVLRRASLAGAKMAGYTIVRLNGAIGPLFVDWLQQNFPDRAQKVIHLIESCHNGNLHDSRFGKRMKGDGQIADLIRQQFELYCKQFSLNQSHIRYNTDDFVRLKPGQLRLF
jgi:DNA repair photolyase